MSLQQLGSASIRREANEVLPFAGGPDAELETVSKMTSRQVTQMRALSDRSPADAQNGSDWFYRILFGAIGWPWLLVSLWGGTKRSKRRLLERLDLPPDALPHLGSWKADTGFLHRIVDAVENLRPAVVVELGAGASTLVCARALERNGGGRLVSYDQHAGFVEATRQWLEEEGARAEIRHAPLEPERSQWPGAWYALSDVPASIDLLIIDGPPWAVHPFVRGAAEQLFGRLREGGLILLDDAARPGERVIARRWRKNWPGIAFTRVAGSTKGTLVGRKLAAGHGRFENRGEFQPWNLPRRIGLCLALFAAGWAAHDFIQKPAPGSVESFASDAEASYNAGRARRKLASVPEATRLDRAKIQRETGIVLPSIPSSWKVQDVQVYPSDSGNTVSLDLRTQDNEQISLYVQRAETPAQDNVMLERRSKTTVAYWEEGPFAYAVTANLAPERVARLASRLSI